MMMRKALLPRVLLLGAVALLSPAANDVGAAPMRGVIYKIDVKLTSVMTHPYFGFDFEVNQVLMSEDAGRARPEPRRVSGTGTFQFKGTDEELQAVLKEGMRASIRGDCDDVSQEPTPVEVRGEGGRRWHEGTASFTATSSGDSGRITSLKDLCGEGAWR